MNINFEKRRNNEVIVISNSFVLFSRQHWKYYFVIGDKYEVTMLEKNYKVVMKLSIKSISQSDFGSYKCVSKNLLGDTDGSIQLYGK